MLLSNRFPSAPAVPLAALAIVLLLLAPTAASAQQEKGDVELEFTGSLVTTVGTEGTVGIGIIQSKLGRFVTDRWQFGVFPSLEVRFIEQFGVTETDTRLGAGAFAVYSFLRADAMTVPYIGGSYYKSDLTEGFDENDSWAGVNAGVKFFINPKVAFDMGGNYLFALQDQEGGLLIMQAGLSFLF